VLPSESGGESGKAELPSIGMWDFQLAINKTACAPRPMRVPCSAGFVNTTSGGCECLPGHQNLDGVCVSTKTACQAATFTLNPNVTKWTDNSTFNISFSDGRDPTNITVLMRPRVALRSATASNTATLLGLGQVVPGAYEVELQEAGSRCTLLSSVNVGCSEGYIAAGGTGGNCTKDLTQCIDTIQWRDPTTHRCRQKPAVAVSGSSTDVAIIVVKTNKTKTTRGTVQVRLTSGDVDPSAPVHWTALLPPSTPWLTCNVLNGTVDGRTSTATFVVDADASGKKDTGGASPLRSTVTVTSTMNSANWPVPFMDGSDRRTIEVSVQVVAVAYLAESDITVSSKEDRQPLSLSRIPVATSLTVTVVTYDCDRLPIERDQQLKLRLWKSAAASSESRNITLLYAGNGCAFNAEIPGTALSDPGAYQLEVSSLTPLGISGSEAAQDSTIVLSLETFDSSVARTVQGAVLGSLGVCVLVGMLFMIFRNPKKAQQLVLSFLTNEFKMLVALITDVWDIIGTLTCPILGDMPCRARRVSTCCRFVRPSGCVLCRRLRRVLHLPRPLARRG
jgi:hypothetical protein